MSEPFVRYGDLEVDEDLSAQRWEWRTSRLLLVATLAVIVAALLGLFGHGGPLASRDTRAGALRLHHDAFVRRGASTEVEVVLTGVREVAFDPRYLASFQVESITPEPVEMTERDDRVLLRFDAASPDQDVRATLHLQPQHAGRIEGWVAAKDGPRVRLSQFAYP